MVPLTKNNKNKDMFTLGRLEKLLNHPRSQPQVLIEEIVRKSKRIYRTNTAA